MFIDSLESWQTYTKQDLKEMCQDRILTLLGKFWKCTSQEKIDMEVDIDYANGSANFANSLHVGKSFTTLELVIHAQEFINTF